MGWADCLEGGNAGGSRTDEVITDGGGEVNSAGNSGDSRT